MSTQTMVDFNQKRADTRPAPTISDMLFTFKSKTVHKYVKAVNNNECPPFIKKSGKEATMTT